MHRALGDIIVVVVVVQRFSVWWGIHTQYSFHWIWATSAIEYICIPTCVYPGGTRPVWLPAWYRWNQIVHSCRDYQPSTRLISWQILLASSYIIYIYLLYIHTCVCVEFNKHWLAWNLEILKHSHTHARLSITVQHKYVPHLLKVYFKYHYISTVHCLRWYLLNKFQCP